MTQPGGTRCHIGHVFAHAELPRVDPHRRQRADSGHACGPHGAAGGPIGVAHLERDLARCAAGVVGAGGLRREGQPGRCKAGADCGSNKVAAVRVDAGTGKGRVGDGHAVL